MKFTISIPNNNKPESSLENLIERLNQLTSTEFFKIKNDNIIAGTSSNSQTHNKIIAILILFFDKHYVDFSTYARIGHDQKTEFVLPDIGSSKRIVFIDVLQGMLKGIKSLKDIKIEIGE